MAETRIIKDAYGWKKIIKTRTNGQMDIYINPPKTETYPKPMIPLRSFATLFLYINAHELYEKIDPSIIHPERLYEVDDEMGQNRNRTKEYVRLIKNKGALARNFSPPSFLPLPNIPNKNELKNADKEMEVPQKEEQINTDRRKRKKQEAAETFSGLKIGRNVKESTQKEKSHKDELPKDSNKRWLPEQNELENSDNKMEEQKIEENAKESPPREEKLLEVQLPKDNFYETSKIYFSFFGAHYSRMALQNKNSATENPDKNQKRQKMDEKFNQ